MTKSNTSRRVCQWKVRHADEVTAEAAAAKLCIDKGRQPEHWEAYDCPYCPGWHVGRPQRPRYDVEKEPRDPTLYDAIGHRAYIAGYLENHRRGRARWGYFKRLERRIGWEIWKRASYPGPFKTHYRNLR